MNGLGTGPWLLMTGLLIGHLGGLLSVYMVGRREEEREAAARAKRASQASRTAGSVPRGS